MLVVDVVATPDFLDIRIAGRPPLRQPVDIVRNSAPVLLVALGMTLVIATRGIDLSVGAVAAIAGAVACTYIVGPPTRARLPPRSLACTMALAVCVAPRRCGTASWSPCWASSRSSPRWC